MCLYLNSNFVVFLLHARQICRDEFHKGKVPVPETKVGEEGSAKRNIQRKHDADPSRKPKPQHGGGGGKGKWNEADDGTIP